ncbi:MAG: sodium-dependent transporter [Candidatus Zixiibacteriota bacterium]
MTGTMTDAPTTREKVEYWGTRLGCILAVAGSAVGLGNFLRFPGQAVQYGGGAFMIPYFCALLFLGIPIGWAEWTLGRYGGRKGFHSVVGIFGMTGHSSITRYVGVLGLLIPFVIYMYYSVIEAWCLQYAWGYLTGGINLGADPQQYAEASGAVFNQITGADRNGLLKGGWLDTPTIFWLIVFLLNFGLIYRGLTRGIENFCRWAMPAIAVCAIVVLIRVLTLGTPDPTQPENSVINGLGFMWNPDFSALGDFKTWLAAAGQVFFSLSVGFGIIMNYSSYLRKKDDVVLSALTASSTNATFEVAFGGLISITAAFVFLGAAGTTGGTFGLGFNTLPIVFEYMGPIGRITGAVWFLMLFLAAITSSLSMLNPLRAFVEEALSFTRKQSVTLLMVLTAAGALWVLYFSQGLTALDTMDFWVGTALIFIVATTQIIIFAWIMGIDRGLAEAHQGAKMRIPKAYRFIIKYVAPVYLLIVFIGFCIQNLPGYISGLAHNHVARYTIYFIGFNLLVLIVITQIAVRRWKAAGIDIDGRLPDDEGVKPS